MSYQRVIITQDTTQAGRYINPTLMILTLPVTLIRADKNQFLINPLKLARRSICSKSGHARVA